MVTYGSIPPRTKAYVGKRKKKSTVKRGLPKPRKYPK